MILHSPALTAALSILLMACATPAPALQPPADPNCMTPQNIADVLAGQGVRPIILNDEQNAAWRAVDAANSSEPDAPGFTYVVGQAAAGAVLVGFNPQGCMAYYTPIPPQLLSGILK